MNTRAIQQFLQEQELDGWLLYDFRGSNPILERLWPAYGQAHSTRRLFIWIPSSGEMTILFHKIEQQSVAAFAGEKRSYASWQELETSLAALLQTSTRIAMEYSPRAALPYISYVDGGTIELIRSMGMDIVSSADLIQKAIGQLTADEVESHREAATVAENTIHEAWSWIEQRWRQGLTEYEVQKWILARFAEAGCVTDSGPICAVGAHSADPHYCATEESSRPLQEGELILIDLWCKRNGERTIYADICRVAVLGQEPTERQNEIFSIVLEAQGKAFELIANRQGRLEGWEVDRAVRDQIIATGYGDQFIHRTGHNISYNCHGDGTQLDDYETHDTRALLPLTCFSVEPAIYLPGEFGVRLESDVLLDELGQPQITGGRQTEMVCL